MVLNYQGNKLKINKAIFAYIISSRPCSPPPPFFSVLRMFRLKNRSFKRCEGKHLLLFKLIDPTRLPYLYSVPPFRDTFPKKQNIHSFPSIATTTVAENVGLICDTEPTTSQVVLNIKATNLTRLVWLL